MNEQKKLIEIYELTIDKLTNEGTTRTYASHDLIKLMDSKYFTLLYSNIAKELVDSIVAYLFKSNNSYTDQALYNLIVEMFYFTFKNPQDAVRYAAHLCQMKEVRRKQPVDKSFIRLSTLLDNYHNAVVRSGALLDKSFDIALPKEEQENFFKLYQASYDKENELREEILKFSIN